MKRAVLLILYFSLKCIGIINFFYLLNRRKLLTITYHNIIPDELYDGSLWLRVSSHSVSAFEQQIRIIKRRLGNRCQITFDDGYKNWVDIVAPILHKYQMRACFFISFKPLETGKPLTIDAVLFWINFVPPGKYKIYEKWLEITQENKSEVAANLHDLLFQDYKKWETIEKELNSAYAFSKFQVNERLKYLRLQPLDYKDIKKLAISRHSLGAHSWDHKPLATMPLELQDQDFAISKKLAMEYCNTENYSYPYGGLGEVSSDTARLCEKGGFDKGFMNIPEVFYSHAVNPRYMIPRSMLPNDSNKYIIEAKLSGLESFLKKAFRNFLKVKHGVCSSGH